MPTSEKLQPLKQLSTNWKSGSLEAVDTHCDLFLSQRDDPNSEHRRNARSTEIGGISHRLICQRIAISAKLTFGEGVEM